MLGSHPLKGEIIMYLGFNPRNHTDRSFIVLIVLIATLIISTLYYQIVYAGGNPINLMATVVAAAFSLVTVGISYDSYKLNRANHRLALFEKRYEVYTALKSLLASIAREGNLSKEASYAFREKHMEATFLFEKDILNYLNEIELNMNNMESYQAMQGIENLKKRDLLFDYFIKELVECDKKFMRYLSFREL
jgi:hypothetical protein